MGHPIIPPENAHPDEYQYRAIIGALVHMLGGSVVIDEHELRLAGDRAIRMTRFDHMSGIRLEIK